MAKPPRPANDRWPDARHPHTRDAPLPEGAWCFAPDADLIRTTPPLAAA